MTVADLIDDYCRAWNEANPDRRAALLASVWAPGATYTDPTVHAVGAEELLAHIAKVQAGRPGARVLRTSDVEPHHDVARFAWHVVQADGTELPEGLDVVVLTPDGSRIERVIGFFGPVSRAG